ncbi:MAG: hypothetical protein M1829_003104 [Trizodia sp. TS-e1964]|nr:MAG: hypothetical protein M1829_003104 [Trizodia sp. TS-e1964]
MSIYTDRKSSHLSYIDDLNAIPTAHDLAMQQQDNFSLEDDLAMFTNTQFFDFDLGEAADTLTVVPEDFRNEERARREGAAAAHKTTKGPELLNGEYQFPDYGNFSGILAADLASSGLQPLQPLQTNGLSAQPSHLNMTSPTITSPSSSIVDHNVDYTLGSDGMIDAASIRKFEEASRNAAEEDKRRRNTAASARFRVKKKQREQALERTAKDMGERNAQLEARIGQLEMENKWLKNLITEKNESKDDIADLWRKFNKNQSESRSLAQRQDGVGTTSK